MTLPELIDRHRAYLQRCSPKSAPYVRRELETVETAAARIQRLEKENEALIHRILMLSDLYRSAAEGEEIATQLFLSHHNHITV